MSDLKSKMPDLQELGAMASRFLKDMKVSIESIIEDYKKQHPPEASSSDESSTVTPDETVTKATEAKVESKAEAPKVENTEASTGEKQD